MSTMSTKRKAPAKIANPVVRQSAKKPLKPQINESETAVSAPGAPQTGDAIVTDIINISSDAESSEYELSDRETDHTNAETPPNGTELAIQKPTGALPQKQSDGGRSDLPMVDMNIPDDAESDQELAQPTLGELARAHGTIDVPSALIPQSDAAGAQGRSIAPPTHSSLGTVLSQALRTDDSELLASCLHVNDGRTIDSTVQRLDSTFVNILLTKLISTIHQRPGRALSLMFWVQSILVSHGGALAAQPGIVKRLRELQHVLDERARNLDSLLVLKGKLDLVKRQLEARRQRWNPEDDADVQEDEGIVYVEGEDSDGDVANGLMDLDDDELPVTNGIMDDGSDDDDFQSDVSEREEELDAEEELDEDEVNHEDVDSDEAESEAETGPEPPSKRSKISRGR